MKKINIELCKILGMSFIIMFGGMLLVLGVLLFGIGINGLMQEILK